MQLKKMKKKDKNEDVEKKYEEDKYDGIKRKIKMMKMKEKEDKDKIYEKED